MSAFAFSARITPIPELPQAAGISLAGSITLDEAARARDELLNWIRTTDAERVVVELAGIERMDTSGAAVLAEAVRVSLDRGRRILLCSPSDAVRRIFELAGFEDVLQACCADPAETRRRLTA